MRLDVVRGLSMRRRAKRRLAVALIAAGLVWGGAGWLPAAQTRLEAQGDGHPGGRRLILKDGSYQLVTKYEVHGDRVRYLSTEREDWEEIPSSLIDWPATNKWNQDHAPGAKPEEGQQSAAQTGAQNGNQTGAQHGGAVNAGAAEAAQIDREEQAARLDAKQRQPVVAPGLQLPDSDGVWVLDYFQGVPELLHLEQSQGDVNRDASHNVLRAAVDAFHGDQEPVRLAGQSARVRLHVDDPVIYVSVDNPQEEIEPDSALVVDTRGQSSIPDKNAYSSPDSRYAIVRLEVNPGERVIGAMRLRRLGMATQSVDVVPAAAEILPGRYWMKLTPKEPLTVGEYALMEILGPGQVNLDVWDFAVSPNSPENRHPLTPIR